MEHEKKSRPCSARVPCRRFKRRKQNQCPDKSIIHVLRNVDGPKLTEGWRCASFSTFVHRNSMTRRRFGSFFSFLLPERYRESFLLSYLRSFDNGSENSGGHVIYKSNTSRNIIACVLKVVKNCSISVDLIPPSMIFSYMLDSFLLDVTLNRSTRRHPRLLNTYQFSSPVYMVNCEARMQEEYFDQLYRTIIIFTPSSSTFYSPFALKASTPTGDFWRNLIPLPSSWLRLSRLDGAPSIGSYIKKIHSVYRVSFQISVNRACKLFRGHQFDDEDVDAPLWPPDVYRLENNPGRVLSLKHLRHHYRTLLDCSPSNRKGGRRYVAGSAHSKIPSNVFLYDPVNDGDASFDIELRSPNSCFPMGSTCVHVRNSWDRNSLMNSLLSGGRSLQTFGRGNARQNTGDLGTMFSFGSRVSQDGKNFTLTSVSKKLFGWSSPDIGKISSLIYDHLEHVLPHVLRSMRQVQEMAGLIATEIMGGHKAPSISSSVSVNLVNASHYDINDASYGVSIWSEDNPGVATNWFFLMPNVLLRVDAKTYSGLAIKLSHGVIISWDGRVLRHATSEANHGVGNNVYGWFWGADARAVSHAFESVSDT